MPKRWLKINRRLQKQRKEELLDNQWGSKQLFEELFQKNTTEGSQLYLYRRDARADGNIFQPVRVDIDEFRNFMFPACYDEGNAESVYAPENIYDEGDAGLVVTEYIWTEGDAEFAPTSCALIPNTDIATTVTQPIVVINSNSTLALERYYRITGGTTMTITAASGVYDALGTFSMVIKNASGANITIDRSASDVFYVFGGTDTSFEITDGESVTLIATSTTNWDVI